MLIKKRVIAYQQTGEPIYGFTLPKDLNTVFEHIKFFHIQASGDGLLLTSGGNSHPSKQEIIEYQFEECRI